MVSLAVEDMGGQGPECVLVHGWGLNRAVWGGLRDGLAGHCRLRAVDLPGHGASAVSAPGLDSWVGRLTSTVRTPAIWIAWSLGGLAALRVAHWRPDRVAALVLVDTSPRFASAPDWPWGADQGLLDSFAARLHGDFEGLLSEFVALNARGAQDPERRTLRRLKEALAVAPPTQAGLQQGLDIIRSTDLRDELAQIHVPVLVVNGEHDRLTHPEVARWVAERLPRAELWLVKGAAHAPFLSHAPAFQRRVVEFLQQRQLIAA